MDERTDEQRGDGSISKSCCANCATPLLGGWCHACGQREIEPGARRMRVLLGEFFEALTDLDGRFWRSLRALLLQPGRLSREWLDGRRQRWMPPMALFLLTAVAYFLAPALSDFQLPFEDQVDGRLSVLLVDHPERLTTEQSDRIRARGGQTHSAWTTPIAEAKLARRQLALRAQGSEADYSARDLARDYDSRAGEISKLLVIVHVPLIAAALALLMWRQRRLFADHFVVAIHLFSFLLVLIQLLLPMGLLSEWVFGSGAVQRWALPALTAMVVGYFWAALHRVYCIGHAWALIHAVLLLFLFFLGSLLVFRTLQFLLILALI